MDKGQWILLNIQSNLNPQERDVSNSVFKKKKRTFLTHFSMVKCSDSESDLIMAISPLPSYDIYYIYYSITNRVLLQKSFM